MALDDPTRKMAKSDENPNASIGLLDSADEVRRKIKRAVTDSGTEVRFDEARPAISNLLTIYQLLTNKSVEEIETYFTGKGYGQLKNELADVTVEFLRSLQERMQSITDDELNGLLVNGQRRARQIAGRTLDDVKRRMGLQPINPSPQGA